MQLFIWIKNVAPVLLAPLALSLLFLSCGASSASSDGVQHLTVEVIAEYPHDTGSFTQGLVCDGDYVYESTGQYGLSRLRKVRLSDGKVIREVRLSPYFFGEGLTFDRNHLVQITWQSGVAFIYDRASFKEVGRVKYDGEGWGLTTDGSWLVMSDGSSSLTFRDPSTFAVWRRLPVTLDGKPVELLNELEFLEGEIYANVWHTTDIVRIDPSTGVVNAVIDASSLPYRPKAGEDVLNGIAYDPSRKSFLLTGKLWPRIYEVRFR